MESSPSTVMHAKWSAECDRGKAEKRGEDSQPRYCAKAVKILCRMNCYSPERNRCATFPRGFSALETVGLTVLSVASHRIVSSIATRRSVGLRLPARERAFAADVFNAGSNVGAILAPVFVPVIALR